MASGKEHDAHGLVAGAAVAVGAAAFPGAADGWLWAAAGVVFGALWLSPDLDLTHSRPSKRWGPLRLFWWPYAKLCAHRGLSHHPIWGPLGRLAWFAVLAVPFWGWLTAWTFVGGPLVVCGVMGTILGSWVHLLGDWLG